MKSTRILLFILTIIFITTGIIAAQPPGMPGMPSQAPLDTGLVLLAAAGGAYILKKLRDKTANTRQRYE